MHSRRDGLAVAGWAIASTEEGFENPQPYRLFRQLASCTNSLNIAYGDHFDWKEGNTAFSRWRAYSQSGILTLSEHDALQVVKVYLRLFA